LKYVARHNYSYNDSESTQGAAKLDPTHKHPRYQNCRRLPPITPISVKPSSPSTPYIGSHRHERALTDLPPAGGMETSQRDDSILRLQEEKMLAEAMELSKRQYEWEYGVAADSSEEHKQKKENLKKRRAKVKVNLRALFLGSARDQ